MKDHEHTHEDGPHVHRVVLPTGKTIEVVYSRERPADHSATPKTDRDLHICPMCESKLVYPTEWSEAGPQHWNVDLRCPECEWRGNGVFDQAVVERFDEELDQGTASLVRDLRRLVQATMEEEIERFVRALEGNHVLPEDF